MRADNAVCENDPGSETGCKMSGVWELAGRARNDFADLAEGLDDEQWAADTLCPGWTPHDVLAHLVWHTEVTVPSLLGAMVRSRFDFEKAVDRAASELAKRPREELLRALRERADEKSSIPGAPESGSVADTAIHTQDIRRALSLGGGLSPEIVLVCLEFLTTNRNARFLMNPRITDGLQLTATDLDWSHGIGQPVEGTGEAIVMALTGRPVLPELTGGGVGALTARLAG